MKKVTIIKIIYWGLVVLVILGILLQNSDFLLSEADYSYNLIHWETLAKKFEWNTFEDRTVKLYNAVFFGGCFLSGLALAFVYSFFAQLKLRSNIRFLNKTCESYEQKVKALENEVASLRSGFPENDDLNIVDVPKKEEETSAKKLKKKK